ncbi:endonuclease domain-containing protein [Rhizorhabdus sp.]|uniref:endonuclease domain-containing protein n=1 Tax=Rhizorhabdus sp. TaxID=1968843 RepID=UPI001B50B444|nr:endonuclease domain-containing protein [Rhizorhabdus sp.]MBP8233593.1 endonuclease domain-containing protein [Rhizorhabdus sp.]
MRNNPTEPEKRLWRSLSNSQIGHKIRRQSVIDGFIVDFLCPAKALVIEIDGDTHDVEADRRRDALLYSRGYRTIRFTNEDVMNNIGGVLEFIAQTLAALPDRWPHPHLSPEGEGLIGPE